MYYLRARYYDPKIGRFTTEDSYWGKDSDALSLNLYVYCTNNPIRYVDPSGHDAAELYCGKDIMEGWEIVQYGKECTEEETREALSLTFSLLPGYSDVKDWQEAITGKDWITKKKVSKFDRALTIAGAFLPIVSGKVLREAFKHGDEVRIFFKGAGSAPRKGRNI